MGLCRDVGLYRGCQQRVRYVATSSKGGHSFYIVKCIDIGYMLYDFHLFLEWVVDPDHSVADAPGLGIPERHLNRSILHMHYIYIYLNNM